ncbi:hypothetical protein LOCC1_G008542, partial [Lachnellula occidentalis]
MDSPRPSPILRPTTPRLNPRVHPPSRPSSRLSMRERATDDILTDLAPSTTFEAFTSPSGKLRASIDAASQSERAFGIRATLASKKIQEWVNEVSGWSWPTESASAGFEMPTAKRRKISDEPELEYRGSLPTADALRHEIRMEEITGDMEDLNFEQIKRQVLDTHFSPKSRPSSSASSAPMPSFMSSYTKMDDFTAIVTATVLQALPSLSRLMRLMDVWSVRLEVLRKVPPLLTALDDTEVALKSGWRAMQVVPEIHDNQGAQALSRDTFNVMKSVLQDKVTNLGQDLDYMLDTLEGRPDTLPDSWLDRMEAIEQDYGEWAVAGDRRVREGEWARMARARKEAEDARRAKEAEEAEAARLKAEKDAEVARILAQDQAAEAARLKAEQDAEAARILAEQQAAEAARRKAAQDAEDERSRVEQLVVEARLKTEREEASARILAQEQATKSAKRKADEDAANARRLHVEQIADAARRKAEQDIEDERLKSEQLAKQVRLKTAQDEEAARTLAVEQAAKLKADRDATNARMQVAHAARRKAELDAEDERIKAEQIAEEMRLKTEKDAENARQQTVKDAADAKRLEEEQAMEAARRKEESNAEDAKRLEAQAAVLLYFSQQQARKDSKEAVRISEEAQTLKAAQRQAGLNAQNVEVARRHAIEDAEKVEAAERDVKAKADQQYEESVNVAAAKKQPTHIASPEIVQRDEEPVATRAPPVSITGVVSTDIAPSIDTDSEANESTYSRGVALQLEKFAPFDGSSDVHPVDSDVSITQNQVLQPGKNMNAIPQPTGKKTSRPANIRIPSVNSLGNILRTLPPSSPLSNDALQIRKRPGTAPADNRIQDRSSPSTPKSKLRLGHAYAEFVRHSSPSTPTEGSSRRSPSFLKSSSIRVPYSSCMNADHAPSPPANVFLENPTAAEETHELSVMPLIRNVTYIQDSILANVPTEHRQDTESADHILASTETGDSELLEMDDSELSIQYSRNSSVSGYSISRASPEIFGAEPAGYFRPVLSPIESPRSSTQGSEPATPTVSRTFASDAADISFSTLDDDEEMSSSTPQKRAEVLLPQQLIHLPSESEESDAVEIQIRDNIEDNVENSQSCDTSTLLLAHRASLSPIDTSVNPVSLARPHSSSSETPTIVTDFEGYASTPMIPSSPLSAELESFPEIESASPSAGRVGIRNVISHDYSPLGSPVPTRAIRKRGSLPLPSSPTFSTLDPFDTSSLSIDAPTFSASDLSDTSSFSTDAPIFDNVQVSADKSISSSPTRTSSSDQLEQQISTILDSIPTKIRLSSKPDAHQSSTLRPKKTRRSVTPSLRSRSHSSMSNQSRAPTPSFLLSPDQSQTRSRPRPQNGAPETKLYHLSRSNGEAPIKLLVRLVGENGERVMVRVGGGWADLGEYLKEYASHHGRRNDKIEIQDIPSSRNVSGASTVRGLDTGRSTPVPESRPASAFDRPMSSLNVRKMRKSMGESDARSPSPSTPLPMMPHPAFLNETPPSSNPGRSSSRMSSSWAEDDSSLGLAGPKSKKVAISERDQEWVESMKEKVRMASAEKEKREKDREFGQMERVGGRR